MANRTLTVDIIAKEALMLLDNNLKMGSLVHRAYEDEFDDKVNGYKVGSSISINRPDDATIRTGATMSVQDVQEGKVSLSVDQQAGTDFRFTSTELTLSIGELSERVLKPRMIRIANYIDQQVMALYDDIPNWVGTAGNTINSFSDFMVGVERANEFAMPDDGRSAVLSPTDHAGLLGSQTALYINGPAADAYRKANLGMVADVSTYMAQNVPTHTAGSRSGSILIDLSITSSTITYNDVKDTWTQTIHIDALGGATQTVSAGDVFTIADVYAVNPITKARLPFLRQFVVKSAVTAASSETDLVISPPILWSGKHQTVDITAVSDLDGQAVTFVGTASTGYRQNLLFHKNAFALVVVPMVKPAGAVDVTRHSYKGTSVRMIPVYDGTNDTSAYRLDVLFGVKTLDERLAIRVSGT